MWPKRALSWHSPGAAAPIQIRIEHLPTRGFRVTATPARSAVLNVKLHQDVRSGCEPETSGADMVSCLWRRCVAETQGVRRFGF